MIATPVPFSARVPIIQHHTGNAIRSSQEIYHGQVPTAGSGPAPRSSCPREQPASEAPTPNQLPPRAAAAAAFSHSCSLGKSHRLQIKPTSHSDFAKPLTKISLSRPRPLLPRRVARAGPQSVLSSRVVHVGTRAGAVLFSPRPVQGPRWLKAQCWPLSGPPLSFYEDCTIGKNKIKFRNQREQPLGANTKSRSTQNTNTATAKKSRHLPSPLGCLGKTPGVPTPHTERHRRCNRGPLSHLPPPNPRPASSSSPEDGKKERAAFPTPLTATEKE